MPRPGCADVRDGARGARGPRRSRAALVVCIALGAVVSLAACERGQPPAAPTNAAASAAPSPAALAAMDRGVGLMGQFDFDAARTVFAALVKERPGWLDARLNLALATLNRQQDGDEPAAAAMIRDVLKERPADLRARYLLGIIALHSASAQEAEPHLREVVDKDPADAYAKYFLGQATLAQGRAADALALFDGAVALEPHLRSADYAASQALQRLQRADEAAVRLERFQRQRNNPLARLAEFKYTRMGEKAQAIGSAPTTAASTAPVALPAGALFAAAQKLDAGARKPAALPRFVAAADLDGDGEIDFYVPGGDGPGTVLLRRGERFEPQPTHPLAALRGVTFAAFGDLDNDGRVDAVLCGPRVAPRALRHLPDGTWKPAVVPALNTIAGARDCLLVDADHDGDLDLLVVTQRGTRTVIANNGDGSFQSLEGKLPKAPAGAARQFVTADLDQDRDLDLVLLHDGGAHEVLQNDRAWAWKAAAGFDAFVATPAVAAVAADLDVNGSVQIVTLDDQLAVRRWARGKDGAWTAQVIVPAQGAPAAGVRPQLAVVDLDGDGRPEIVATTPTGVAAFRVAADRADKIWNDDDAVHAWTVVTRDASGPGLVVSRRDGSFDWIAPGPGRHAFAAVAPSGRADAATQVRSNASGIGVRLGLRAAGRWATADTLRNTAGPGQSVLPVALGLGGAARADFVTLDWPDGVMQTELGVPARALTKVAETQRQLSSCPVIFAWNGERFSFVSDFLGVGGLGYLVKPGEYAPPRPWENFLLPAAALQPKDGRYAIKIAEPMEETAYIDQVQLVAHDLPPGWDMALDERMGIGAPDVTGKPLYFRREALPVRATNERGEDVTAAVRTADLVAAEPGAKDPRFVGRLAGNFSLTLEFATDLDRGDGQGVLIFDGWIEYPYSQTMFAAWQAKADYRAPTLEARGADGRWRAVLPEFGYPAGMPRRAAVPVPRLPRGTRALRLTTNQEIYWDRVVFAWTEPAPVARTALTMVVAEQAQRGFARRTTAAQQRPFYDYAHRAPLWDTRVQDGYYTRLGRIEPLVAAHDDAVAVIGPGEEIHLEFAATLPPLAQGWTRRFVLETRGWAKDMDLYTGDGERVGPMPTSGRDAGERDRLNAQFNTRWQSGR